MRRNKLEVWPRHSECADTLTRTLAILDEAGIGRDNLWLGGGAALAARWKHRNDPNVRLFIHREKIGERMSRWGEHVAAALQRQGSRRVRKEYGWVEWETGHGQAGLYTSDPLTDDWLDDREEANHGLPVERTRHTLDKKVQCRMANLGEIRETDLMDLAASMTFDPEALRMVMRRNDAGEGKTLAEEIRFQGALAPSKGDDAAPMHRLREYVAERLRTTDWEAPADPVALPPWWNRLNPTHVTHLPMPRQFGWDIPLEPIPSTPVTTRTAPFDEEAHPGEPDPFFRMEKDMAGSPVKPVPEEVRDWLNWHDPRELPDAAHGWLSEAFAQLQGSDAFAWRQRCGASLVQIARTTEVVQPLGRNFRLWLNRYAALADGKHPSWYEGYGTAGCPRRGA